MILFKYSIIGVFICTGISSLMLLIVLMLKAQKDENYYDYNNYVIIYKDNIKEFKKNINVKVKRYKKKIKKLKQEIVNLKN